MIGVRDSSATVLMCIAMNNKQHNTEHRPQCASGHANHIHPDSNGGSFEN